MIYNGTDYSQTGEGTQIGTSSFNSSSNDNAYVGYLYGQSGASTYEATHSNTNNSTIKGVLDSWYKMNILDTNYDKYVSKEAGFCGDRRMVTGQIKGHNGNGIGWSVTSYASWARLYSDEAWKTTQTSTYNCDAKDFYTTSSSKGNKSLTYPIGLISSDEVVYAGGFGNTSNQQYWLYTNKYYWTMSPFDMGGTHANVFFVKEYGYLTNSVVNDKLGVRPVINLASDVKLSGSGTTTDPYRVEA